MTTVKTIDVAVVSTVDKYEAGMKQAGTLTDAFNKDLSGLSDSMSSHIPVVGQFGNALGALGPIAGVVGGAFAGAGAAVGIFAAGFHEARAIIEPALDRLEESALAADRLGILTAELQKLQYAAEAAGNVGAETFNTALEKMSKNISDADAGNKSAIATFQQLGLSIKELTQLTPDQAFLKIADAIAAVENPMDRVRLTTEVFGKSAAELVNVLQEGSEGIRGMGSRAEELRLTISQIDAANVKAAKDAIDDLKFAFEGLGNVLATTVAPVLSQVLRDLTDIITKGPMAADAIKPPTIGTNTSLIVGGAAGTITAAGLASMDYFRGVNERSAIASNPAIPKPGEKGKLTPAEIQKAKEAAEELEKQQERTRSSLEAKDRAAMLRMARSQAGFDRVREREQERAQRQKEMDAARLEAKDRAAMLKMAKSEEGFAKVRSRNALDELRKQFDFEKNGLESARSLSPAAVERGTQSAFQAFNANRKGIDLAAQQVALQKKMVDKLEELKKKGIVLAEAKL